MFSITRTYENMDKVCEASNMRYILWLLLAEKNIHKIFYISFENGELKLTNDVWQADFFADYRKVKDIRDKLIRNKTFGDCSIYIDEVELMKYPIRYPM